MCSVKILMICMNYENAIVLVLHIIVFTILVQKGSFESDSEILHCSSHLKKKNLSEYS